MMFRLRSFVVWFFAAANLSLAAAEVRPDLTRLTPITPLPELVEAAQNRKIPIEGIDPPSATNTLNPGDSATTLFTLFEKGEKKTQWVLLIEADAPGPQEKKHAPPAPVVVYAGAGDKLEFTHEMAPATLRLVGPFIEVKGKTKSAKVEDKTEHVTLDKGFLAIGHDEAAAAIHRIMQKHLHGNMQVRDRPFTEAEIAEGRKDVAALQLTAADERALIGSSMALESYFDLVGETPGLDDVAMKVVKLPSIWSVVEHFGVRVNVDVVRKDVAPMDAGRWALPAETPCYDLPLVFRFNDQPAIIVSLLAVPARPPMLSCGGIISLLAEKPGDKDTYLILQIISAHCRQDSQGEKAASEIK
jgi:hypothetical protein